MKALGLGIAAALLLASAPVMAADLVVDVPDDVVAMASDWDGAYAGVGGFAYVGPTNGFGGVGNVGVNQTFGGNFLFGVEGYAGLGTDSGTGLFWLVGAEGRLGVLASDAVLVYGAGGVEWDAPGGGFVTLGGGVEFAVADNMTLDVEYKHFVGAATNQIGVSLNFGF
jgi:outer membrane immunogenic protein